VWEATCQACTTIEPSKPRKCETLDPRRATWDLKDVAWMVVLGIARRSQYWRRWELHWDRDFPADLTTLEMVDQFRAEHSRAGPPA
jgi:hypothetical protein